MRELEIIISLQMLLLIMEEQDGGNWGPFVCILTWRFAEMQVAVMRILACMPWFFVVAVMILA
jgi:hypothetical protein